MEAPDKIFVHFDSRGMLPPYLLTRPEDQDLNSVAYIRGDLYEKVVQQLFGWHASHNYDQHPVDYTVTCSSHTDGDIFTINDKGEIQ